MNTQHQGDLMRSLEGAVAAAIVAEWRENKVYPFSFPAVIATEGQCVKGNKKQYGAADLVHDGYDLVVECFDLRTNASIHLTDDDAESVAERFTATGEPSAKLRKKVQKLLTRLAPLH